MDPPSLMNQGSFPSEGAAAFNMAEIWPFSISGGGNVGRSEGGSELRRSHFGPSLGQFGDSISTTTTARDANRDVAGGDDSVVGASQRARKQRETPVPEDDSAKVVSTSGANGVVNDCKGKRLKSTRPRDDCRDDHLKVEMGVDLGDNGVEQKPKPKPQLLEPPKQDYIHVRARRGQATDSHSLAERARREKISERMKILQDLVPGCNKVIGKALVLDEIINYIQSLQRQVEFLSMKLEAVNSRMSPGIEGFPLKDFGHQPYDPAGVPFSSQATRDYVRGSSPEWLHMQVGGGFDRTT